MGISLAKVRNMDNHFGTEGVQGYANSFPAMLRTTTTWHLGYSYHEQLSLIRVVVLLNEWSSWLHLHYFDESCEHVNSFCLRMYVYGAHYNLRNVTPSLISQKPRERMWSIKYPSLLSHLCFIYHEFWYYNNPPKNANLMIARVMMSSMSLLQCWLCGCKHSKVDKKSAPVYESRGFLGQMPINSSKMLFKID